MSSQRYAGGETVGAVREAVARGQPYGPVGRAWLIFQRLRDVSSAIDGMRGEVASLRSEVQRLSDAVARLCARLDGTRT